MKSRRLFLFLSLIGIIVAGGIGVLFYADNVQALVYGGGSGDSTSISSPTVSSLYVSWSTSYAGVTSQTVYRNSSYLTTVGSGAGLTDSGLSCGTTYSYYICSNYGCTSSGSGTTVVCAPAAPTGFTATPASQTQNNLSWTASSGATGYYVYRNGVYIGSTSATSYADTGLSCNGGGSYYVVAYNAGGNSGASNSASASTDQCTPGTPTIGSATCVDQTTATVTWTRGSPYTETAFEIHSSGGPLRGTAGAGATSGTASGLTASTPYAFYVNAYVTSNGRTYYSGNSANSNTCTTLPNPPATPTGFTATAASPVQINLLWYAASDATSYTLSRTGYGVIYSGWNSSFNDTGLNVGTSYSYSLTASNTGGTSAATTASATTLADTTPPDISFSPTQTSYTSPDNNATPWGSANVSVTVTATDAYSGIASTLYCWTTGASCTPVTSFTNGTAISQTAEGAWTLCIKATDTSSNTITSCKSPYDIDKTAPGSTDTWSSVSTNGYVIYAGGNQGYPALPVNAQTTGAVLSPEHVSWCSYRSGTACDPTLANPCVNNTSGTCAYGGGPGNPTYFGNVFTCYDNSTCSGPTYVKYRGYDDAANYEVTVHSFTFNYDRTSPVAPTVTPTVNSCSSITWSLSGSSDANVGLSATPYAMNTASTDPSWYIGVLSGKWAGISGWSGWQSSNAFAETGLTANTSYTRYFMARDALGNETSIVSATASTPVCPPSPATNLSAAAASCSQINMNWTAGSGATSYNVYRCAGTGCTPTTYIGNSVSTSYSDTGLSGSALYRYKVVSHNSGGDSGDSNIAEATTPACNIAPNTPTLVSPANGSWVSSRQFCATVSDPDGGNVTAKFVIGGVTYSGSTVTSGSQSCYTHTADLNGVSWYAYAQDPVGATSGNTASWTAYVDTTPVPGTVSGLSSSETSGGGGLSMSWNAGTNSPDGYMVYVKGGRTNPTNAIKAGADITGSTSLSSYSLPGQCPSSYTITVVAYKTDTTNTGTDATCTNAFSAASLSGASVPTGKKCSDVITTSVFLKSCTGGFLAE